MSFVVQPSLLDGLGSPGEPVEAVARADVQRADVHGVRDGLVIDGFVRHELSHGAWVDLGPSWWPNGDDLFARLRDGVAWRAERREMYERVLDVPRLVAFYGEDDELPDPDLTVIRDRLNRRYGPGLGEPLVSAGLCLYRDGSDSVAWHGDTIGRGRWADTLVAILSLGAARPLLLRPRRGGPSRRFVLGHGDLLVMGGSCQRTWEHAVPKTARSIGPRISVQFRPSGVR